MQNLMELFGVSIEGQESTAGTASMARISKVVKVGMSTLCLQVCMLLSVCDAQESACMERSTDVCLHQ